ncbi:syntaxin-1A isoform X2 [Tribolium castaneum]|uniref:syntaxin-1A isoform X2 n=1 Tax=Tribolium castaneum TaxID=7070 RepID=UPI00046C29F5|nr:PREDICTED: syntaxin-1A isoform X2 [Tribolium castaneum]|eukprot:XP_008197745.1 PREDICTED: syntaxin-1A isoform X2 [Tribolium castaneum]
MVKDRLNELKQKSRKNEKAQNTTIEIENNSTQNDTEDENKKLRQTFERAGVIAQWIEQIESNNQDIRVYLRRLEDLKYNQKDVDEKLNSFFQNNKSIAQQLVPKLKEVDKELSEIKSESTEKRIKTIQYNTSKKRFEKAFLDNNQLLENYKSAQKAIIKSQLQARGYFQATDDEVARLLEEGTDIQVFTENILAETAEAKRILADVEERHQTLLQIERLLIEVRDLFVEMSILIDSQQELIDRIDYQAQSATDHIGAVDLAAVRRSKRKYMKRKLWVILAIIVLVIILLVILLK